MNWTLIFLLLSLAVNILFAVGAYRNREGLKSSTYKLKHARESLGDSVEANKEK